MDAFVDKDSNMDVEAIARQVEKLARELAVLQRMVNEGVPTFPDEKLAIVASKVCLNCNKPIGESREVRGCHEYCYKQIKASLNKGEMTEFQAIQAGLILPKETVGGKRSSETQLAQVLDKLREDMRILGLSKKDDPTRKSGDGGKRRKPKAAEE